MEFDMKTETKCTLTIEGTDNELRQLNDELDRLLASTMLPASETFDKVREFKMFLPSYNR